MSLRPILLSLFILGATAFQVMADTKLIMVEEHGCIWCDRWNEEISDIYPKTAEGKAAPLHRIDIHAARPDGITFARGLHFTPTFVLVVDGGEVARIEGYPGEDFFWGLLGQMLTKAEIEFLE